MSRITTIGAAASTLLLALFAVQPAAYAQNAEEPAPAEEQAPDEALPGPDTVVATVGERKITLQDLAFASEAFGSELAGVAEAQRQTALLSAVINMELLSHIAREQGLDQTDEFKARVAFLTQQALQNAYVSSVVASGLTAEELEEGYQTYVVTPFKPQEQVHARHILVGEEDKALAEQLIGELQDGAVFADLAKEHSIGPTAPNGGDLGFFGRGQMAKPFEEAAFALEPGQFSEEPVQTQYGWHVILVEERRMTEPPALAEVEPQLRDYLMQQKIRATIADLRETYPVVIVGAEDPAADADADGDAAEEPAAEEGESGN